MYSRPEWKIVKQRGKASKGSKVSKGSKARLKEVVNTVV